MGEAPTANQVAVAVRDDLRAVMRNFATGVCVVTTFSGAAGLRTHNALTINSLTSVSLDPPLISLSIRRESTFLADLMDARVWAISILDAEGEDLARIFSRPEQERKKALGSLPAKPGERTGALLLDSSAWLECRYWNHLVAGDHLLIVGEVVALGTNLPRAPLVFLRGECHRIDLDRTG